MQQMDRQGWVFVKSRTAAKDSAVWRAADGTAFMRTGPGVLEEAAFQRWVATLGYPVPKVLDHGRRDGVPFFVEEAFPGRDLHDTAVERLSGAAGILDDTVAARAAQVSAKLLTAQAGHPVTSTAELRSSWLRQAGFTSNVFAENPDLDTRLYRDVITRVLDRVTGLPMCFSHLDYGLPAMFQTGVIDWQHGSLAPVGYDVVPALEIVAFKGGAKGYQPTPQQRAAYLTALDDTSEPLLGQRLGGYLSEFLIVKALFFLALMKPTATSRPGKHTKWLYRRHLFISALEQYDHTATVDTSLFPTLDDFAAAAGNSAPSHP